MRSVRRVLGVLMLASIATVPLFRCGGGGGGSQPKDTTPPAVTQSSPTANSTNVSPSTTVTARFSEAIDPTTLTTSSFYLMPPSGPAVPASVTLTGTLATLTPSTPLAYATTYTAFVGTGVRDLAGNPLSSVVSWSFTTAPAPDLTPPSLVSTAPTDSATGVAVNAVVSALFSEALDPATVTAASVTLTHGGTPVSGGVQCVGATVSFTPTTSLAQSTTYTATITTTVKDLAGNPLVSPVTWSFTTLVPDLTPPSLVSTTPADAATGIAVNTVVSAVFSEALDPATVTAASFTLDHGGTPVPGSVQCVGATVSFTPTASLAQSTTYTATITAGVKDLAGNPLVSPITWSFTTAAAPPPPGGTLDATFGTGGALTFSFGVAIEEEAHAVAVQPDGRIVVGGFANLTGGLRYFALARLLADGTLDPSFGTGGKVTTNFGDSLYPWDVLTGLAIQPDGKIVAVGGYARMAVARYNSDGSLDTTFNAAGSLPGTRLIQAGLTASPTSVAYSVALQPNGKILVGGQSTGSFSGLYGSNFTVIRLDSDGTFDAAFGQSGIARAGVAGHSAFLRSIALQSDGKIVAAGYGNNSSSPYTFAFARFTADGVIDTSFGTAGSVEISIGTGLGVSCYDVKVQGDGKIVGAGTNGTNFTLVRLDANGSLDATFGAAGRVDTAFTGNSAAMSLVIQTNGRLVAGGYALTSGTGFALARYLSDGSLDPSFGAGGLTTTGVGGLVFGEALALQGDGKIVLAGTSSTDAKDFAVARFWP